MRPLLATFLAVSVFAADPPSKTTPPATPAPKPAAAATPSLNSSAAKRNENVAIIRIDTDVLKEANVRLGVNYAIVPQSPVETSTYSGEHGRPARELSVLRPAPIASGFHLDLYDNMQNSVFNARTFFQSGPVKPSRQNQYGARATGHIQGLGDLTFNFSQRKIQGMVNGNVLVPLAHERLPKTNDPALRAIVLSYLAAYPNALPNRTDFDQRMLNTNAPQLIHEINGNLRLDRAVTTRGKLILFHDISRQNVDAFQLVAGQNPDTSIHSTRSRATFQYAISPHTDISVGGQFTRVVSLLTAEPNAVGPRVRMGYQIEELGPDSHFPIDRAQNTFRWGFLGAHRIGGGRHTLTFGADASRLQLNGTETNDSRGVIWFQSNFGRTAIDNLLYGTPTTYQVSIGQMARGFRNWEANAFVADQWRVTAKLQLYFGLRFNALTTPTEVNNLNTLPYPCDCNNLSPRLSITYQLPRQWVLRTSYNLSYDQIPPVTAQQVRYNAPLVHYVQIQNPSLLNPLASLNLNDPNLRTSPIIFSRNLVVPYSHQYNLRLERKLGEAMLRIGYFGSRTFQMMNVFIDNRAEIIPGMPLTTANVDARRADPRYYDVRRILNGGIAYLDGAQATLDLPRWKGITSGFSYTFSKAIDEGSDFTATAANRDLSRGRAQAQYESFKDRKGLSNFDSTHAVMIYQNIALPKLAHAHAALRQTLGGWTWANSALIKSGTPLTLFVGSDAPGFGNVDGGPSDRPNIVDPSILGMTISHPDIARQILRRDRFDFIHPGERRGSLGRNTLRKAGIANWNSSLTKRWRIGAGERWLQFRAESINLGNHPQFDEPNRNLNAEAFGKITNALNDGRVFQLGLRIIL
ncbi:MAG: TonB-dependent receptor [Acidobacteria bacterium]|nr:TonB-dependent receptor [Acidobacteriota bacterium]